MSQSQAAIRSRSQANERFRSAARRVVSKDKKRQKTISESDRNIEALGAGGVGAVRRHYEGETTTYTRQFELGFDVSEPCTYQSTMDNLLGIFTEFFCTGLFLFFNITQISFLRQGNLTEVSAGNLDSASRLIIALQFGVSIFVLVYFAAGISGAHINPAVTFAMCLGNRISIFRGVFYIAAQMLGATVGTAFAKSINQNGFNNSNGGINALGSGVTEGQGLLAEIFGTMLLVLVVFTATNGYLGTKLAHIPTMLPWSIGMAVFIAHLSLIPVTGCSINPARSFGPAVVTGIWKDQWLFWLGPLLGAACATLFFELVFRLPEPNLPTDGEQQMAPLARALAQMNENNKAAEAAAAAAAEAEAAEITFGASGTAGEVVSEAAPAFDPAGLQPQGAGKAAGEGQHDEAPLPPV